MNVECPEELQEAREEADALRAQYESEKEVISKVRKMREEIDAVKREIEKAEREYDLNKAAELKHGRLPELQQQLKKEEGAHAAGQEGDQLLREEVTEDEIAEIVSRWTGIPVTRLMEGAEKLKARRDSPSAGYWTRRGC